MKVKRRSYNKGLTHQPSLLNTVRAAYQARLEELQNRVATTDAGIKRKYAQLIRAKQLAVRIAALRTTTSSSNLFDSLLFYLTPLICLLPDYFTPTLSSIQHNVGQLPRNYGCFIHYEAKSAEAN